MPREKREEFEAEVVVAFTLEEAHRRVQSKSIDVRGAKIVVDTLTNEVRGTRARQALNPDGLVHRVHQLRRLLMSAGAAGVVLCQLKPMEVTDVTPYNRRLHEYLQLERGYGRGGYGCRTQIRLGQLKPDGYHLCMHDTRHRGACPTPDDAFTPTSIRRRWEAEWPRLESEGRAHIERHGWRR